MWDCSFITCGSVDCLFLFLFFLAQLLSCVGPFATAWTVARHAPLPMGFFRQEYLSSLPFPSPGDLPDPGIKFTFPALAGRFFTTEPPGKTVSVS